MKNDSPVTLRLLKLATPVIGLNVLNVLALAVDTAMLGRLEDGETALTGLGFATSVLFLLMVAMIGLTVGTVASVSRAHGAEQRERVSHIVLQSVQFTVLLGLTVAVVGNLIGPGVLALLGATGEELTAGLSYLRPMLCGACFTFLNILFAAILRGVGNTQIPFRIALISNALNVFLNYGLIHGNLGFPALGISGAALGTVTSQLVAVLLLIAVLRSKRVAELDLGLRPAPPDFELGRTLLRIGWPASLDVLLLNAGFLSIIGMLGRIDPLAVAAHGIGLRIQALAFVPGMSVSQATGAMVGNALGAANRSEAYAVSRAAILVCTVLMSTLALLIGFFAGPLIALFDVSPSSPLGQYATMWMYLLAACMPFVGVYIAFVGIFQGAGATRLTLRINALVTLVLQIPASYVLGFPLGLGAFGVWLAFPVAFVVKAVLGVFFYHRAPWATVGEPA